MMKRTFAAAITAAAMAMTMPLALGQPTADLATAPPAASQSTNGAAPDAMYGRSQGQGQGTSHGPGMMGGNVQGQGPGQGGYGPGMMGRYGLGWMGGSGGIWVLVLIVILAAGIVAWFVKKKGKANG